MPAVIAVKRDSREVEGRPAFVAAGMTLAGMVVLRRLVRIVT